MLPCLIDEVLEVHKRDTVSTFGIRSSRRVAELKKGFCAPKVIAEAQNAD